MPATGAIFNPNPMKIHLTFLKSETAFPFGMLECAQIFLLKEIGVNRSVEVVKRFGAGQINPLF